MLKTSIAIASLVSLIASSVLVPAAMAASMEREIVSIAKNGRDVAHNRKVSRTRRHKTAKWKTTSYNWNSKTKKTMSGYVPPKNSK